MSDHRILQTETCHQRHSTIAGAPATFVIGRDEIGACDKHLARVIRRVWRYTDSGDVIAVRPIVDLGGAE